MKKLPLPNLHDASLEDFSFDSNSARLVIKVSKYKIDKEPAVHIKLTFSGIMNAEEVFQLNQQIRIILQKERRENIGYRIENLSYCNLLSSKKGLSFAFDVDHLGSLHINCSKLSIHDI